MRNLPPVTSSGRPSKNHNFSMLHGGKPAAPRAPDITLPGPFYASRAPKLGHVRMVRILPFLAKG